MKNKTIQQFVTEVACKNSVPGGGGVSALVASLGAGLIAMLSDLTVDKKGYEQLNEEMKSTTIQMQQKAQELLDMINDDAVVFNNYMASFKLPKDTDEQRAYRRNEIQSSVRSATKVPMRIAETAYQLFSVAEFVVVNGNKQATSDGLVATLLLRSAVISALYNVKINLPSIDDDLMRDSYTKRVATLIEGANEFEKKILKLSTL